MKVRFISNKVIEDHKGLLTQEKIEELVKNKEVHTLNFTNDFPTKTNGESLPPNLLTAIKELAEAGVLPSEMYGLDFSEALLEVDLPYKAVYTTIENANFDETILIKDMVHSDFFFSRHLDGESVYMNDFRGNKGDSTTLEVNAGGYQVSFKDKLFRKDYKDQQMRRNAARGYRHHLNALYMKDFVDFTGTQDVTLFNASSIKATAKADMTWFEKNWYIIKAAKGAYAKVLKDNKWTGIQPVVYMNSVTESWFMDVADAVDSSGNKRYPSLTSFLANRVVYDGASLVDGDKTVTHEGFADGEMVIVVPKGNRFIELVKTPLTVISDEGLAANLGQDTTVMYDCRGKIANSNAIIKVEVIPLSGTTDDSPIVKK